MQFKQERIMDGPHVVGILHRLGSEVHFEIHEDSRYWWATQRTKVRAYFQKLLDEPLITTRTAHDQIESLKLIPRLGFTESWRDEHFVYYILERLPFTRKLNA